MDKPLTTTNNEPAVDAFRAKCNPAYLEAIEEEAQEQSKRPTRVRLVQEPHPTDEELAKNRVKFRDWAYNNPLPPLDVTSQFRQPSAKEYEALVAIHGEKGWLAAWKKKVHVYHLSNVPKAIVKTPPLSRKGSFVDPNATQPADQLEAALNGLAPAMRPRPLENAPTEPAESFEDDKEVAASSSKQSLADTHKASSPAPPTSSVAVASTSKQAPATTSQAPLRAAPTLVAIDFASPNPRKRKLRSAPSSNSLRTASSSKPEPKASKESLASERPIAALPKRKTRARQVVPPSTRVLRSQTKQRAGPASAEISCGGVKRSDSLSARTLRTQPKASPKKKARTAQVGRR
ncbi:hypothetical protein DFP72DRAFT_59719 [Ephemerocybe angulata]|uniref:Uncharacterized protein n=1 Tax=Ephemerocybe angulata TaxID=980116 RepID=A0A8H6HDG4_9AGAR|nr:hypothetical protein DFP72DRAFT_59719 [Tulosesus angulatus]